MGYHSECIGGHGCEPVGLFKSLARSLPLRTLLQDVPILQALFALNRHLIINYALAGAARPAYYTAQ